MEVNSVQLSLVLYTQNKLLWWVGKKKKKKWIKSRKEILINLCNYTQYASCNHDYRQGAECEAWTFCSINLPAKGFFSITLNSRYCKTNKAPTIIKMQKNKVPIITIKNPT